MSRRIPAHSLARVTTTRWRSHVFLAATTALTTLLVAGCAGSGPELTTGSLSDARSSVESASLPSPPDRTPAGRSSQETNDPARDGGAAAILADAHALRTSGRKRQALERIETAPGNQSDDLDIQKTRAMLALELGQLDKAELLLKRTLARDNGDWRLHSALGSTLSASGRQQDAQFAFAKALELSPDNPAVLNNLALSYALTSDRKRAKALLRRVLASSAPKSHVDRARQNLALLAALGTHPKAGQSVSSSRAPTLSPAGSGDRPRQGTPTAAAEQRERLSANAQDPQFRPVYRLGGPKP